MHVLLGLLKGVYINATPKPNSPDYSAGATNFSATGQLAS